MRKIHKNEPHALGLQQRRQSSQPFGWGEINDDTSLKNDIKAALLEEQGGLCAYTGIEVDLASSHIEHMKGRAHKWGYDSDTDDHNMLACYPNHGCDFGAMRKENWPPPSEWFNFITPVELRCESCFAYGTDGSISADGGNVAAQTTIEQLALDHRELEERRRDAIDGVLASLPQDNVRALKAAAEKVVDQLERKMQQQKPTRLREFVFVLVDAIRRHVV